MGKRGRGTQPVLICEHDFIMHIMPMGLPTTVPDADTIILAPGTVAFLALPNALGCK